MSSTLLPTPIIQDAYPAVFHHRLDYLFAKKKSSNVFAQYVLNPSVGMEHFQFTIKVLLAFLILRFLFCGAVGCSKISRTVAILPRLFKNVTKPKRQLKFAENVWYFIWHLISFCWGMRVIYLEGLTAEAPGWSRLLVRHMDDRWYWFVTPAERVIHGNEGWPLFPVQPHFTLFYLTQLGFWMSCFVFVWIEAGRKDFNVLTIHHFTACTLIAFSFITSYWRPGVVVLVIHDSADIFLYLAKALHYTFVSDRLVDTIFLLFVVVFFSSRLIAYPLFCVFPFIRIGKFTEWSEGLIKSHWDVPGGIFMPGFLFLLQMLHIFWFGLICKMIFRTLSSRKSVNEVGDITVLSDDEDHPESHSKSTMRDVKMKQQQKHVGVKDSDACVYQSASSGAAKQSGGSAEESRKRMTTHTEK